MRKAVLMPHMGYDMKAGKIAKWLKKPGEAVQRGEILAEIETDKAIVEMEAQHSGVLVEILVEVNAEVDVDSVIACLEVPG